MNRLNDRSKRHLVHCLRVAATEFDESAKVFLSSAMKRLVYQDAREARELADRIEAATSVTLGAQRKWGES